MASAKFLSMSQTLAQYDILHNSVTQQIYSVISIPYTNESLYHTKSSSGLDRDLFDIYIII